MPDFLEGLLISLAAMILGPLGFAAVTAVIFLAGWAVTEPFVWAYNRLADALYLRRQRHGRLA